MEEMSSGQQRVSHYVHLKLKKKYTFFFSQCNIKKQNMQIFGVICSTEDAFLQLDIELGHSDRSDNLGTEQGTTGEES